MKYLTIYFVKDDFFSNKSRKTPHSNAGLKYFNCIGAYF